MPGLYVHIPFCHKACYYCNFHFSTNLKSLRSTLSAIRKEAELQAEKFRDITFNTLYFGGGTPSLLDLDYLSELISVIWSEYKLHSIESTLEANPEDITSKKLEGWLKLGFDRLSIGIQTFDDAQLKTFNRNHTSSQARQCIDVAKKTGFKHFNLDLIFGFPGQTLQQWDDDLQKMLEIGPEHISVYALTREEGTAYNHLYKKGMFKDVDETLVSDMFYLARERLTQAGYLHYEVSNYALPGHEARHNSNYWTGDFYLGLGPSAHSYIHNTRWWNFSNNALYEKALFTKQKWYEEETLTNKNRFNEIIITGIRTSKGISIEKCKNILDFDEFSDWYMKVESLIKKGIFKLEDDRIILHPDYLFISDTFAVQLLI
ncbi:coproporphyrinogen III oxidase [Thermaurantimonas aggregans]|uniref:Heme chaperone HemW n=1 Tax=Thermaurantimonas aggregans TaxID=2173829 RepID=A0A401XL97_9FLAO|nr:radical SAM family heme chaperone HemW [Thermaurantimonas aggregans]MCX8148291.1 radical SAM family heme chaperone HemW [Thermaurantimonas aggregans]GCD77796.1 coproporphyrinogen III oxidase [Thermaurantimonas aggregans]